MAFGNVRITAPADGQPLTDAIARPAISVAWDAGTGPYDVDYVWDDDPLFGDANGHRQTASTSGTASTEDTKAPSSDLADLTVTWYLKVTVTDTGAATSESDEISVVYFAHNPHDRADLYLLGNVGVGFTPTDDPASGWGTGGTQGPDGDIDEFRRHLYLLSNVGVGFKHSDEPIAGWGTGGNPDGGDGDEITFDRYLYLLENVTSTQPCPRVFRLSTPIAKVGDAVVVYGQGLVSGDDPTDTYSAEVRLYPTPAIGGSYTTLNVVTWEAGDTEDSITVTIPNGAETGYIAVVHTSGATCTGSNLLLLTVTEGAESIDAGWWVEAWSLDGQTRVIAGVPVEDASFQEVLNGVGSGQITLPATYERLAEIIDPDKQSGGAPAPVQTLIKVFLHGRAQYAFFAEQIEQELDDPASSSVIISGDGIESTLGHGKLWPADHPNPQIRSGDTVYGSTANYVENGSLDSGRELIPNPGFEEGDELPWEDVATGDIFADNTVARTGAWSMRAEPAAIGDGGKVSLGVKPGQRVFISGWVRGNTADTAEMEAFWVDEDDNEQSLDSDTVSLTATWKQLSVEFTVPDDVTTVWLQVINQDGTSIFWVDDVTGANTVDPWVPSSNGVTLELDDSPVADGTYSMKVTPTALHHGAVQVIRVVPGDRITLSAAISGTAGEQITLRTVMDGQAYTDTVTLTGTPTMDVAQLTGTVGPDETQIRIAILTAESSPNPFWVDAVSAVPGLPATSGGGIGSDLLADIQARGALTQITTDFTENITSDGEAWADPALAVTLRRGDDLLDVVDTLASFGVDWSVDIAYRWHMYNRRGIDRTLLTDCPVIRAGAESVVGGKMIRRIPRSNAGLAEGAGGIWTTAVDPDLVTALGRREFYMQATQATSASSLQAMADHKLEEETERQSSLTLRLSGGSTRTAPYLAFSVGDSILVDIPGIAPMADYPEGFRVVAITADLSSEDAEYTIDLNWMVLEEQAAQAAALRVLLERARIDSASPGATSAADQGGGSLIFQAPAAHTHPESDIIGLTQGLAEGDPAGGDLGGIYPNPSVVRVRGKVVDAPTTKGDLWVYNGTKLVRLGVGSDGQVLKADSAESSGLKWAAESGGGGGGSSYDVMPGLKPPDSAHADDDEFDQANGTDPTSGAWSWANQGGATAEVRGGRLAIHHPGSGSYVQRGIAKAAPSGSFTATTMAVPNQRHAGSGNQQDHGLGFLWGTLAAPTRIETIRHTSVSNGYSSIDATRWNNYTSFSTNHGSNPTYDIATFLRLTWDDSTGRVGFLWSVDPAGYDFVDFGEVAGPGSAPDYVVLYVGDDGNRAFSGFFRFIRFDWTPDFSPS